MVKRLKPYLRWFILGATIFFLAKTLKDHWQGVLDLRFVSGGLGLLVAALAATGLAHVWSGWVWGLLLRGVLPLSASEPASDAAEMGPIEVSGRWAIATYLRTNIAKYLPGNIWHFYSRLQACKAQDIALAPSLLSIVLEPLLMAAAALLVASGSYPGWQTLGLVPILVGVHPNCLNPILQRLAKGKLAALGKHKRREEQAPENQAPENQVQENQVQEKQDQRNNLEPSPGFAQDIAPAVVQLQRYPLKPLLGEVVFVLLRGLGFVLSLAALSSLPLQQLPMILGGFSLAWVLGLVVPGAPGGVGVFESVAIALLQSSITPEILVGAVAIYRLVSTVAEGLGAGASLLLQKHLL